jgi:hypothetical protein
MLCAVCRLLGCRVPLEQFQQLAGLLCVYGCACGKWAVLAVISTTCCAVLCCVVLCCAAGHHVRVESARGQWWCVTVA